MSVKSIILGSASVAALVLASNASAADVARHHYTPAVVSKKAVVPFSWEGLYVGAQAGYSTSALHSTAKGDKKAADNDIEATWGKPVGINGGVYAGYNIDLGSNLIAGLDADINLSRLKKSIDNKDDKTTSIFKEKYNGSVRGRLGYNLGRALPYVAGGFSFANIQAGYGLTDGKFADDKKSSPKSKVASGWNIGGGVDYLLSDNLVLRADYRYETIKNPSRTDYDAHDKKIITEDMKDVNLRSNNFRVGVAYKF